jgi:SAM-dependent methyltransferase
MNQDVRAESRDRWTRTAAGWEAQAAAFNRATMPVSSWMVEAIGPQPGHQLLELATGTGDTGFLAAELILPGGTLTVSDFVPEMLSAAQRRAAALGIENVRFRQIDADLPLDIEAASLDGVLSRWGYHLLGDGEAALRETRRVLRPGGRVALSAWADPAANPWTRLPAAVLEECGLVERVDHGSGPGQFAWWREGVVADHLDAAGFVEYEVATVDFVVPFAGVAEWWRAEVEHSLRSGQADATMNDATRAEVLDALREAATPWLADDGSLALPARTWVAAATA